MKHLTSVSELSREEALQILDTSDEMSLVNQRQIRKLPTLRGKTVANLFYEDSTRTKLSFEAARQISERMDVPLHPIYTYYWSAISKEELEGLREWILTGKYEDDKLIVKLKPQKRSLELIGVPHKEVKKEDWNDQWNPKRIKRTSTKDR